MHTAAFNCYRSHDRNPHTCTPPPSRLPEKIAADPEGQLVAFAHSDIGTLNNVIELWRYPSAAACIK